MENNNNKSISKIFECTICLDTAKDPILTKCGHMFCWPCIYNWLDTKEGKTKCPNCKNEITKHDLIPVYSSNENIENTNRFKNIPERPKAERNSEEYIPEEEEDEYQGRLSFFSFNFGHLISYLKQKLNIFNYLDLININNQNYPQETNIIIHNDNYQNNNIRNSEIQNSDNQNININNNNNNQRETNALSCIPENALKTIINFIKFFLVFLFFLQITKLKII